MLVSPHIIFVRASLITALVIFVDYEITPSAQDLKMEAEQSSVDCFSS